MMIGVGFVLLLTLMLLMVGTLLLVSIFSPKFRGLAVGMMILMVMGGFALVLVGSFVSYRRAESHRQTAMLHHELSRAQHHFHARSTTQDRVSVPSGSVVIRHANEGMVEVQHPETYPAAEIESEASFASASMLTTDVPTLHAASHEVVAEGEIGDESEIVTEGELVAEDDASPVHAEVSEAELAAPAVNDVDASHVDDAVADSHSEASTAESHAAEVSDTANSDTAKSDTAEVEIQDESTIVVPRPGWVVSPPRYVDGRPAVVVASDKFVTALECEDDLRRRVHAEALRYAKESSPYASGRTVYFSMNDADFRSITNDEFTEIVPTTVGPMKQIHQLIVFDSKFDRSVRDRYRQAAIGQRLTQAGVMSGGVLMVLATLFGFLKVSSRTVRDSSR